MTPWEAEEKDPLPRTNTEKRWLAASKTGLTIRSDQQLLSQRVHFLPVRLRCLNVGGEKTKVLTKKMRDEKWKPVNSWQCRHQDAIQQKIVNSGKNSLTAWKQPPAAVKKNSETGRISQRT